MGCGASSASAAAEPADPPVAHGAQETDTGSRRPSAAARPAAIATTTGSERAKLGSKPVTLADDSPPSSPGLLPQRAPAGPSTPTPAGGNSFKKPEGKSPSAKSPDKGLDSAKKAAAKSPSKPKNSDDEDEETEALRAAILAQTEDLDTHTPTTSTKKHSSSSEAKKAEKAARAAERAAERERRAKRRAEREKAATEEKQAQPQQQQATAPFADKYGGVASATSTSANTWQADSAASLTNSWSVANGAFATAAPPGGGKFTSWSSTSRAKVVVPPPKPVEDDEDAPAPLALPSWQQGFDPEKFRQAQGDLKAAEERRQNALVAEQQQQQEQENFGSHLTLPTHSTYQQSTQSTARDSRVDLHFALSNANSAAPTHRFHNDEYATGGAKKDVLSTEEEAMLEDLLADL